MFPAWIVQLTWEIELLLYLEMCYTKILSNDVFEVLSSILLVLFFCFLMFLVESLASSSQAKTEGGDRQD